MTAKPDPRRQPMQPRQLYNVRPIGVPPPRQPPRVASKPVYASTPVSQDLTWGQALAKFIFSFRFPFLKMLMAGVVVSAPVEAVLELVPGVDAVEDVGFLGIAIRLFFAVRQIKRNE